VGGSGLSFSISTAKSRQWCLILELPPSSPANEGGVQSRLNPREIETMNLLSMFLRNKEIADRLHVSLPLAQKLIRRSLVKIGANSRAEGILLWRDKRVSFPI
jgi:DNA-binding CsgD family transcriptional regulator